MASRILGFFLGLFFISLTILPFITPLFKIASLTNIVKIVYYFHTLGPIPTIVIPLFLIGVFCLYTSIKDKWPFYG